MGGAVEWYNSVMFFNWKGITVVLAAFAAAILLCAVDLHCSGGSEYDSRLRRVQSELAEGKRVMRQQEAENLARMARGLRVLAKRYREKGENKKAQRAIGAAQELDKKIAQLLEEKGGKHGAEHQ